MKTHVSLVLLAALLSSVLLFAKDKYPVKTYDLAASTYKGEQVRGPRTIKALNLNTLRYDYSWDSSVTFVAGPDLWKALTQVPTTGAAQAAKDTSAPKTKQPPAPPAIGLFEKVVITPAPDCMHDPKLTTLPAATLVSFCEAVTLAERGLQVYLLVQNENKQIRDKYVKVADDRTQLNNLATKTNAAILAVADAGADLQSLLQEGSITNSSLVDQINTRLRHDLNTACASDPSAYSVFMYGVKACWPFQEIATARNTTEGLRTSIEREKIDFQPFATEQVSRIGLLKDRSQMKIVALEADLNDKKLKLTQYQLAKFSTAVGDLQDRLADLETAKADLVIDATNLDNAGKEADKTLAGFGDMSSTSSKYTGFRDARELLLTWQQRMTGLYDAWMAYKTDPVKNPDPFSNSRDGDCDFAFSQTKKTALTLSRTDRMPGTKDTKPEAVLSATVECTSPFAVTAGVAFSSIQEREFAIVPSSDGKNPPGVVNKFQSTAKSSFHPLPLGMIHARLWEGAPDTWRENVGLHASFGMAGNFRSQNSGGSDVEFLAGPSVSLFRTMFVTPGLHIGHKVSLGGGFNEGDIVPSSITQPPLQKSYKLGFGLAITFTKP
ncbi:MAG TPA: hypothetical protein VI386_36530 [Candidatus Sulfotelmatobacter sp.]